MPRTPVVLSRTYLPTSSSVMLLSNSKLAPSSGLILKLLSSFRGAHFAQELDCISASTFSWGQLQLDGHGQNHNIFQFGVKMCPQGGKCPTWRPYMRNDYNYILWDDKIRLFDHFIGRGMAHLVVLLHDNILTICIWMFAPASLLVQEEEEMVVQWYIIIIKTITVPLPCWNKVRPVVLLVFAWLWHLTELFIYWFVKRAERTCWCSELADKQHNKKKRPNWQILQIPRLSLIPFSSFGFSLSAISTRDMKLSLPPRLHYI